MVATSPRIQMQRLTARDGSTEAEAQLRIDAQLPVQTKVDHPRTTEVIWNNGTKAELLESVDALVQRLRGRAGLWHRFLTLPGLLAAAGVVVAAFSRL